MNSCVLTIETTGLPSFIGVARGEYPSYTIIQKYNGCRLIQLSWVILNTEFEEIDRQTLIIKPRGFLIPIAGVYFHGIMTEDAMGRGIDFEAAMETLHV